MVSNDIVMPLVLHRRDAFLSSRYSAGWLLLACGEISIFAILFLAYMYYRSTATRSFASIGLFPSPPSHSSRPPSSAPDLAPRHAARAPGMTVGILIWAYTLLLPSFADAGHLALRSSTRPWASPGCGAALLGPRPAGCHASCCRSRSTSLPMWRSRCRAADFDRTRQADLFALDLAPIHKLPLWRSSLLSRTHHHGRALSWRGARAHLVRQLRLDARISLDRKPRPTSSCCAMPSTCSPPRSGGFLAARLRSCCGKRTSRPRPR